MNINSAFPSTYIKASDLQDKPIQVTIRDVKIEQVGRDKDSKMVLYFEGKTKGMVLNKTNARNIASIAGSQDTDDWVGIGIIIYPTETEFAGESVECIRVRAPKQGAKRQRQPGEDDFTSEPAAVAVDTPKARPKVDDDPIPF
jgi:hypothetical protein